MGDGKGSSKSKDDRRRRHRDEAEQGRRSGDGNKLTEEEQRLYDKARAYVEQEEKTSSRSHRRDRHHKSKRQSSPEDDDEGRRRHGRSSKTSRHRKERKKKDKSRDKKYHSSDEDDSDVSNRRDRKKQHKRSSRDDDDRYEKSRSKKKSKHRHHHDDDYKDKKKHSKHGSRKSREKGKHLDNSFRQKATKLNNKNLISLGDINMKPPQELLHTDTNYFSHNSHLRLYLYRQYGIYFEDLTSNESHDAFQEFVSKYNNGELETAYYDPKGKLPQEALDQCSRTQHKWNFSTNRVEEQALKMVRDGVKKQTEYDAENNRTDNKGAGPMVQRTTVGPMQPVAAAAKKSNEEHNHKLSPDEKLRSDKHHRERIKVANEEMYGVGKADRGSWERKIEKRREQSNRQHGAARDRESEAGAVELDDNAIYGGGGGGGGGAGDISYEAALAREKKYRERREAAKNERTTELLKKEEDKQKKMLEMLGIAGLKPGEKIKIQPRQP